MPITVEVPELGRSVEFPDDMSHEDIASAITQHLGSIAEAGFEKAVGVSQKAASMFGVGRMAQESMLRAEAKTELQRQQREAQVAGDIAASESASAGVGEQVAEFARTFPQRAIKAPFELAQAAGVPIGKPTLSPDEIAYLRSRYAAMESPLTPPQPAGPKEQAITDWLNEQASGLTSPEMVGAVGAPVAAKLAKMSPEAIGAAGRLIARGFQAQMAAGVPEAVQQTVEAPDVPSAIKGGLSTAAAVGLPLAIEAGLTKPLPKIPDYPGLRFRSERGVPTALGNEELQAEAAKQAAILEYGRTAKVQDLRPAVKTMDGEVVAGDKGQSHNDIIEQNKIPAKEVDRREFVDTATGQEVSREKLATAIPTKKEGEAHSSDLAKAQEVTPVDVSKVESVRGTENGGRIAIILPDGTAVVGGVAHPDTWNKAVDAGVATDAQLANGVAGYVKPDGTAWGVNGQPLPKVSKAFIVGQREASAGVKELGVREAEKPERTALGTPPPPKGEKGAPETPPPTPAPVKAEPGADVYQSMRGEMHRVWVKLPDKPAIDVGSIEEHPELSDKVKAIDQANKVWASREQKPIPPRSLPAYGISSKDVAKQYGMPEDFYGTADEQGMVSSKYRTKEYDAAVEAEQRASKIQGINGPTIRRQARERTDAEFRKIVESARKAEPSAPPPPAQPKGETGGGELKALVKANVKADPRLEEPGISKKSKPNSLVVQLRDLESYPVREIVLESSGDPITDAKTVEKVIKENARGSISLRESLAVTTGPNGRAILKFGMSPSGMTWANADKFVATREFAKASRDLADARLTYIIGEPREKFANAPKSKLKIMQAYWKAKDALSATEEPPSLPTPPPVEQKPPPPAQPKGETGGGGISERIIKKVGDEDRGRHSIVERRGIIGDDGKTYYGDLPTGVRSTGKTTEPYYVFQTRDGTTVGKRYATREEAESAKEQSAKYHEDEMRKALEDMSPEQIQSQADYWLKEKSVEPLPPLKPKAAKKPQKPLGTGSPENDAKLANYRQMKRKGYPMTAMQERALEIYEAQAKADPSRWSVGQGIGWRVDRQINRGFRIAEIDHERKLAKVVPVADTGLTITGGGMEGIGPEWVHIADLVRDKKYDVLPTPPPVEQKGVEPEKGPGMVGMGGALTGEVETGHGADIYGIAERVRAERAKAGQVSPVEPGEGISAQESVEHGRELLDAGANAEQVLSNFEKTKQLSSEDMAVVRAQGERLAQDARRIEEQFGTTSQQYLDAWKRLSDWDARSKAMQTEWHRTGQAQQGETDIDTGTFTGLQRAHKEATGKDFTPQQAKKAKDVADKSAKATAEADKAKAALNTELAKEPPVTPRVKALSERLISTLDKSAETALARIKKRRAEGRLFTGIPVEDMADYAIYGASKITKGLVEFGKWSEEMIKDIGDFIKPHLKDIWEAADKRLDFEIKRLAPGPAGQLVKESITTGTGGMSAAERRAFNAEKKTVRENAIRIANLENKARTAEVERNKAIDAIEAASKARGEKTGLKQTREEAIRTAKGATKARLLKAERDKATADAQLKAARDAQAQAQARAREYAAKVAQTERRLQGNPMKRVWNQANIYLEKGLDNFDEIRNKVATDLGMTVNQVTRLMAQSPRIKQLANDLWRKQQNARRLKEQAKRWVWSLSTPGYLRALQMVPRAMFGLKVGFHGTVALGTHAPMVAFQPRFWATYVTDFGKMYRMVGSKTYYEQQVQDLMRRPNYITARRAGLVNDPFVYEDYNSPDTAKYFGNLTGMGNRGYTVLKIIRQDMFDQMWEKLPKTAQIPEVAQAIADGLNHATGVVKGRAPRGTNVALFAPRLEASRVMWLAVDPAKMLGTFLNWKNASTGDRVFAMNQLKEKAWVFGTLAGMLALNQGFLTATGSKQKINGVPKALGGHGIDPMESDFLKFKAAGLNIAYGSAMLNMAKLPARMATSIMFHGKTSKLILEDERVYKIAGDYIRSQLSPFAGTTADLALGRDYMGRPLPRALFGTIPGPKDIPKRLGMHGVTKPYTWPEYSSIQFTPIPISEGIHEVWGQGLGMSDAQIDHYLKAWAIISIMAGTGARVTEDYQLKK